MLAKAYFEYSRWSCPRCGELYHYKDSSFWRYMNPFARHCLHCQLPRWANHNPDPDLKPRNSVLNL